MKKVFQLGGGDSAWWRCISLAEVLQLGVQLISWFKSYVFILFMNMLVVLTGSAQHKTLDTGHMMQDARLRTLNVGRTGKGRMTWVVSGTLQIHWGYLVLLLEMGYFEATAVMHLILGAKPLTQYPVWS